MDYNLDKNPKFRLDIYKQKLNTNCICEFVDYMINFKQNCDIRYKTHITKYRTTCIQCNLSLCKFCAKNIIIIK